MAGFSDIISAYLGGGGGGGGQSQQLSSGNDVRLGNINFGNPDNKYVVIAGIVGVVFIALVLLKRK